MFRQADRARILHVYKDVFPPVAGGIERYIDTLRQALPDLQHDVLVCSRRLRTIKTTRPDGSVEVQAGEWGRVLSTPVSPSFPYWLGRLAPGAIVHLHSPQPIGELSVLLARGRSPLVVTYHADVFRQRWLLGVYGPLLVKCLRAADVVITGSERLRQDSVVIRRSGVDARVVPFAVDAAKWSRERTDPDEVADLRRRYGRHVVAVGRLVPYKGFDRLIRAARDLPCDVVIVGDGVSRPDLEQHIADNGVQDKVHLVGSVDDARLCAHLAAASAFVLPSWNRAEAFGIALLEAQAAGLPVIATDVGTGTVEAFEPGVTGLLIPPDDVPAIVGAVRHLLDNPHVAAAMGEAGRTRIAGRNTLEQLAHGIRPVYEGLWERQTAPSGAELEIAAAAPVVY
jgi:glycosyltransferase involved in cell wall biosynthesis